MAMRALLIGRFQPFHKGHLAIIKNILDGVDELIIVVGSSQHKDSEDNPFSADERLEMIRRALDSEGITKFQVYKVPDIGDDDRYPGHLMDRVPNFDAVYSGNSLVQRLFGAAGKDVRKISLIKRDEYSGTEIRRRMRSGEEWEHLVPDAVLKYLDEIGGVERVKKLFSL
jgi:nicotinamide-nucleotide adenylyltransferase